MRLLPAREVGEAGVLLQVQLVLLGRRPPATLSLAVVAAVLPSHGRGPAAAPLRRLAKVDTFPQEEDILHLSSSASYAHQTATSTPYANGGAAAARRKSVSVASAAWASRGGAAAGPQDQQLRAGTSSASGWRLEVIGEPESPSQSQVSSSSSFGRKVARSRSVGCGSRSFSGDFLERISNGFGDCTLRRIESHREPKPNKMRALGHLGGGGADDDDDLYEHQHRMKCAGFFGGLGPTLSSYWFSATEGASGCVGSGTRKSGGWSHRSWAWALASPMRALRPTSSTSTRTMTAVPSSHMVVHSNGNTPTAALSISFPMTSSSEATAVATVTS